MGFQGDQMEDERQAASRQEAIVIQLVQHENERLTRLLRNLYQEFRLGEGDRSQLYEHICRELAQYFRADCCELYLVKQHVAESAGQKTEEVLSLVAAFGPWEAALKPRYVRRIFPTEYSLDSSNHTTRRFNDGKARVDLCRVAVREHKEEGAVDVKQGGAPSYADPEWHVVWPRDNLYNVSRNVISCPVLRHRSCGDWKPYPIGLIKLENRRPSYSRAFEFNYEARKLFFGAYFELCSVAGYVRDLLRRLENGESQVSLFTPMHDGDGWRQHFQEHPAGRPYYDVVQNWHRDMLPPEDKRSDTEFLKSIAGKAWEEYNGVSTKLSNILDLVAEAEVFLQALHAVLEKLRQKPAATDSEPRGGQSLGSAPSPSLFNLIDLVKARSRDGKHLDKVAQVIHEALDKACSEGGEEYDPGDPKKSCLAFVRARSRPADPGKPQEGADKSDPTGGGDLWARLVKEFNSRLNGQSVLLGLLEPAGRENLAASMCRFIEDTAQAILDGRPATGADMVPEVLGCYQCAQDVADYVNKNPYAQKKVGPADCEDQEKGLKQAIKRFAIIHAKACMHAHTFDPQVDEPRLYSIQSHVSQIIDNHLMERMRDLNISFDQLELLGLTDSSVERLELLDKRLHDAARSQERVVRSCLAARSDDAIDRCVVTVRMRSVHDILEELVEPLRRQNIPDKIQVLLLEVETVPKNLQDRSWYRDKVIPELRKALGSGWQDGDAFRLYQSFTGENLFANEAAVEPRQSRRPVPNWLFALNTKLQEYCRVGK